MRRRRKISPLGLAHSAAVRHPAGTVAFSRTASVGFSCILGVDMATSQDFVTWTCDPRLDQRYLLWVLRGERDDILRRTQGSTHKTIYMPDIEQLTIPLRRSTTIVAVVAGVVAVGVIGGMSLTDWLVTFALPSLPASLDASEIAEAHRRMADRKAATEDELIQPLWNGELSEPGALTAEDCRRVQDESFRLRSLGLQVPDWFFWRRRERSEANMHEAAALRREQHKTATASATSRPDGRTQLRD
ncbi:MAG: S-4TM family putative pore-forming effector [Acidimicrobiales bacterium]